MLDVSLGGQNGIVGTAARAKAVTVFAEARINLLSRERLL